MSSARGARLTGTGDGGVEVAVDQQAVVGGSGRPQANHDVLHVRVLTGHPVQALHLERPGDYLPEQVNSDTAHAGQIA